MATREPVFLRFPQVLEKTNVSKSTINRKEKVGRFPPRIKWGGIVLWNSLEIERFMRDPNNYKVNGGKK